jgi:hypothetical protein
MMETMVYTNSDDSRQDGWNFYYRDEDLSKVSTFLMEGVGRETINA